jgi:hypothetical protein
MKGIIFTLDAIIAFGIIIAIISGLIFFRTEIVSPYLAAQRLHSVSEDIIGVLYNSRLKDVVNQSLLQQYIDDGTLEEEDLNKKTADVIGALWAAEKKEEVGNITKDILESFIPNNTGYQILINNDDVYNSSDATRPNYEDASIRISSSRIISGYEKYKPVSGFVARAWASKVRKVVTKIIPINLEWGSYADDRYWYNGYGPAGLRDMWSIIIKNFTIPDDANISYAYMQMAYDNRYTSIKVNENTVWSGGVSPGTIREYNITNAVTPGLNTVNITFRRAESVDLAHFHPGCYIKLKYNTSEIESGSNKTVFSADLIRGAPAANEIIPFFVNTPIRNVTAFVEVKDINAFLLLTLNYKYNASNPLQNVLLYREYPVPIDCNQFLNQADCQASPQCSWDPVAPANLTIFHATFDGWSTSNNCGNALAEGWDECIMSDPDGGVWRGSTGGSTLNSSSTRKLRGSDIDSSGTAYITKCLDLSSYSEAYLKFDWSITGLDNGEYILIRVNKTGSPALSDLWNSGTGSVSWTNQELNVTDDISSYTCFRIYCWKASSSNEYCDLDDFKIIGNSSGKCENIAGEEEVKHRLYELFFNETGTLVEEYDSEGSLLNTWFNTNVTINNIHNDMTNTLGIYADIRPPDNSTVEEGAEDHIDWQRLGMFANDNTAGHENDYYCYITEKSNVTVYHDIERYGLEYGKIDISVIENFTDEIKNCITNNCKDAILNLTFPFSTTILKATVLGTQNWAGNDNGYNFIWMWVNETEPEEAHLVMDTDTPAGTFASVPVQFLQTNKINIIRVGDKSTGSRELNTEPTTYMGNKRSIVEYSFLIPSQVGYGDVFENETDATEDAEKRLNQTLGSFASATIIQKDSFRVGGVPYMYGPFSFRVNVWV